jgi:hypothetical protein
VVFVSSASGVDRLWHVKNRGQCFVSNSLPGLLSITGLSLCKDYNSYSADVGSVETKGLYSYVNQIPSDGPDIGIVYYKNIVWCDGKIEEIEKPGHHREFSSFSAYEKFLKHTAQKLGKNAQAGSRCFTVDMLVALSSGYDSIATAVISKYAGCTKSASIVNSSSLWRGADSGLHIAEKLGLDCKLYRQDKQKYRNEISVWAGCGRGGGRNFTLFDYPKPLCLLFTGFYGDIVWDLKHQGLIEPKGDNDHILSEFRIMEGVFVTVVPYWGIRSAKDIQSINLMAEMKPWVMGTGYDRPIARRLIEEAGIPRGEFALLKKDTASNTPLSWPSSLVAQEEWAKFLSANGYNVPSRLKIKILSSFYMFIKLINHNFLKKICKDKIWTPWLKFTGRNLFFKWANENLRDKYYR